MDQNGQNNQPTQPETPAQAVGQMAAAAQPVIENAVQSGQIPSQPKKSITIEFEPDLKFEVTSDVIDDMRFMELYAEVSEDQLKITKLIKFLLGEANYESIFTYYESKGQRFTITKFGQVFEQLDKDLNANPDFLSR